MDDYSSHCKRLSMDVRKAINLEYKKNPHVPSLARKYKCSNTTISRWIDDDKLYNSIHKIRKPHKKHKKHKKHKRGSERKTHPRGPERKPHPRGPERKPHPRGSERKPHLRGSERKQKTMWKGVDWYRTTKKINELYITHNSGDKVKRELEKQGIKMSKTTILSRIPKNLRQKRGKNLNNKK